MIKRLGPIVCMLLSLAFYPAAHAALSPVSIAIAPGLQFPPEDYAITGLRLSLLVGKHRNVYGLDLGLVGNITEQNFAGVAVSGIFNYTSGTTTAVGVQLAGLANFNTNKARVIGIQAALGANINQAEATIVGLQLAAMNISPHTVVNGIQLGIYNRAYDVRGLQIGLINVADSIHGLQIGLLNFQQKGLFAVAPILNFGF